MMIWEILGDIKESFPTQVAYYSWWNGIIEDSSFEWRMHYILKK